MLGVKKKKDEAGDTLESQSLSHRKPKEEKNEKPGKNGSFQLRFEETRLWEETKSNEESEELFHHRAIYLFRLSAERCSVTF